jgi:hypothetical protein
MSRADARGLCILFVLGGCASSDGPEAPASAASKPVDLAAGLAAAFETCEAAAATLDADDAARALSSGAAGVLSDDERREVLASLLDGVESATALLEDPGFPGSFAYRVRVVVDLRLALSEPEGASRAAHVARAKARRDA